MLVVAILLLLLALAFCFLSWHTARRETSDGALGVILVPLVIGVALAVIGAVCLVAWLCFSLEGA